jgi:acetyl esterase
MPLDPDAIRFFELMKQTGARPVSDMEPPEAREYYRQRTRMTEGPAPEMAETRDLSAPGPAGPIPLRLYRPHGAPAEGAPALVYLHGGGWVIGDLDTHDVLCRQIARAAGGVVIAVDYRLAPEHPFPEPLNDCLTALNWIAANGQTLGIDRSRIGLGGDSAGGNMTASACIHARDHGPSLRCQILIYPSTDMLNRHPSRVALANMPPLTLPVIDWFHSRYMPLPAHAKDWRASPMLAESLAGLPPALVIVAGQDPLHDEGIAYAERMKQAGVETVVRDFPGQIHGFMNMGGVMRATHEAVAEIGSALKPWL